MIDTRHRTLLIATALAAGHFASEASAQAPRPDTVVAVAGARYAARGLKADLLGRGYRDLWTMPVRVAVLDLDTVAGGLVATRAFDAPARGVELRGADGRRFTFRPLDAPPPLAGEPALAHTMVGAMVADQASALNPAGALVAAELEEAAGIPHTHPRLYVAPASPRLGEAGQALAGTVGRLEEEPGGEVISTRELFERLDRSSGDRVDAREYLRVRLLDLVLNDWDRGADRWRWTSADRGAVRYWQALAVQRDYALADYNGWMMEAGSYVIPVALHLSPTVRSVEGLTRSAREQDRRLLAGLDHDDWTATAAELQRRLSDAAIERAVARMPVEYQRRRGVWLTRTLRSRRNSLPRAASDLYRLLAAHVDVHATEGRDLALVDRVDDRRLRVRLFPLDGGGPAAAAGPFFDRVFRTDETREVHLYLDGGDDRAVVRGSARRGGRVRIVGGPGDDVLVDSSSAGGRGWVTALYDDQGRNQVVASRRTLIDTLPLRVREPVATLDPLLLMLPRDSVSRGACRSCAGGSGAGRTLGGGLTYTHHGFRRAPYAYQLHLQGWVGLGSLRLGPLDPARVGLASWRAGSKGFGVGLRGETFNRTSANGFGFALLASQLESRRFYGYGNESLGAEPDTFYIVPQSRLAAEAHARFVLPDSVVLVIGPIAKLTRSHGLPGRPYGAVVGDGERVGQLGAGAELVLDRRDQPLFPRRGALLLAGATAYPLVSGGGAFAEAHATASTYLNAPPWARSVLALRAGAQRVWGSHPVHEAAFLGGPANLRGYPPGRYAGDGLLFGNAELRSTVMQLNFLVRGTVGTVVLADAGRVFVAGEASNRWHAAAGGGVWYGLRLLGHDLVASATCAHGSGNFCYAHLGAAF